MNPSGDKTLLLTCEDVQSIINKVGINELMDILIHRMELEIRSYQEEKIVIPQRHGFNYKNPTHGLVEWMPLWEKGNNVTIKVVGYHPNNPTDFKAPTILSTVSQYDTKTGHLNGIVDGVLLTALRTGAASAIASKHMASNNSQSLGLIGCGAQSITQVHALSRIFDLKTVRFYDVDEKVMDSFRKRVSILDLDVKFERSDMTEIMAKSDIVCTATSIEEHEGPLFNDLETLSHVHINAIGSDFPGKVELPLDIINDAFICPDFIDQALVEGECQRLKRDEIDADLTNLLANNSDFVNTKNKKTVFDSTGWALEDHVVMNLFVELSKKFEIGTYVNLEFMPEDPKDPYFFLKESQPSLLI